MSRKCDKCNGAGVLPSEYEGLCRQLGLTTTLEQDSACRYLESKGLRFCIDFGYENAFDVAFNHMESEQIQ